MIGRRLWHLTGIVAALAVLVAVASHDIPCTPLSPVLALIYLCAGLGILGARWQGRTWQAGLLLGLLLGPIGVIVACSHRAPEGWPPSRRDHQTGAREHG